MKIYSPETAPQSKSIDQRCREAAFGYKMSDQSIEENHIVEYMYLVRSQPLEKAMILLQTP